jgi:hypothetical protein
MKEEISFTATLVERAATPKDQDRWMVDVDGFTTSYSKGTGHRVSKDGKPLPFVYSPTVHDMEVFNDPKRSKTVDPTLDEVLEALAFDASCVVECDDVDDFAAEFGYEGSISETLEAFDGCKKALLFFAKRGLNYADFLED